jgi:hypothetical protein
MTAKVLAAADADPEEVARQIVYGVDLPFGKRPFRAHVDPSEDGAKVVNAAADRVRREMFHLIGLQDLHSPNIFNPTIWDVKSYIELQCILVYGWSTHSCLLS